MSESSLRRIIRLHSRYHNDDSCRVCSLVWRRLERDPSFVAELRAGEAAIRAGRSTKWADIRRAANR